MGRKWLSAFMLGGLCLSLPVRADEVRVAVATNFVGVMEALASRFEQQSGHQVTLSAGATGKLYAQIRQGAPFDLFFAADEERPARLEREGMTLPGSRFTYAQGELVLWSPQPALVFDDAEVLSSAAFEHLAIANPKTAPYGLAAEQTLQRLGLWERLQGRLVRGENIGQTYQFVHSGNAALGFVAKSQVYSSAEYAAGSHWAVPADFHEPIVQQVVQLQNSEAARALLDYVRSPEAQTLIEAFGYRAIAAEAH
ncbi:MAG: molybdate ABC transporter substrate-binding protein [Oceanospirillaceae bacterium]|nr:molybdate ABC transporter substrate-binding protein [Oceanospirillaceae bacterium]